MSPRPTPAKKSSELIKQLNKLTVQETPSEFELRRIQSEAKKLISVDAAGSYLLLGMVHALREQPEEMRAAHENAIRLASQEDLVDAYDNYSVSLDRLGFRDESYKILKKAYQYAQNDPSLVGRLVNLALLTGYFNEAVEWEKAYSKLKPSEPHTHRFTILKLEDFITARGLRDEITSAYIKTACDLLQDYGITKYIQEGEIHEDGESEWIGLSFCMDESTDKIRELQFELYDILATLPEVIELGALVSIRYEKREEKDGDRTTRTEETLV